MYLARSRAASYDGGIVRYADMNVIGITRCVREIIPQHSRVTAFARSGQLQFGQQTIPPRGFFTAENNYCWNDKRPGFYVSVTEIDRVGREIVECPGYRKMFVSERIEAVLGAYKEILARYWPCGQRAVYEALRPQQGHSTPTASDGGLTSTQPMPAGGHPDTPTGQRYPGICPQESDCSVVV